MSPDLFALCQIVARARLASAMFDLAKLETGVESGPGPWSIGKSGERGGSSEPSEPPLNPPLI